MWNDTNSNEQFFVLGLDRSSKGNLCFVLSIIPMSKTVGFKQVGMIYEGIVDILERYKLVGYIPFSAETLQNINKGYLENYSMAKKIVKKKLTIEEGNLLRLGRDLYEIVLSTNPSKVIGINVKRIDKRSIEEGIIKTIKRRGTSSITNLVLYETDKRKVVCKYKKEEFKDLLAKIQRYMLKWEMLNEAK